MKNNKKKLGIGLGLLSGVLLLSGCTASFCSPVDKAEILYPYEQGVTVYCQNLEEVPEEYKVDQTTKEKYFVEPVFNGKFYKYIPYEENDGLITFKAKKASFLNTILSGANSSKYRLPSVKYFAQIDQNVLEACVTLASGLAYVDESSFDITNSTISSFINNLTLNDVSDGKWCINPYVENDVEGSIGTPINLSDDPTVGNSILRKFGAIKFKAVDKEYDGDAIEFALLESWTEHLRFDEVNFGMNACPTNEFYSYYSQQMNTKVSNLRNCIATKSSYFGHYGPSGDWQVQITEKKWSDGWDLGFLEGLLVYPVAWLVDTFAFAFDSTLSGWGQLLALILVTVIVRGIMLLVTFKNTMNQQKMTELQPQLAKIQAKYPNANTNQAEKQRLAQEQMMLYKRNKINPMGSLVVLIFQFPVFICVWSALQGSAALSTGSFLNLSLSYTIKDTLFNSAGWSGNNGGNWTALVLFLLMAGFQIVSMLLPQIFAKKKTKDVARLTANPAGKEQGNKTKTFMIAMMVMTIVMGFFLPSAMGVYWLIGALISIAQTLITQLVLKKNR